jgi:AcrR family transcriptional regulator
VHKNQREALRAILSGENRTIEDVATACGLTERTIYNYLADPAFKAELNQRRGVVIDQATARLASLTVKALDSLESVLDDPEQPGAANLRLAAKDTLSLLDKFSDRELDDRISLLEDKVFHE